LNWVPTNRDPLGQGGQGIVTLVKRFSERSPAEWLVDSIKQLTIGVIEASERPGLYEDVERAVQFILNSDELLGAKKQLLKPDEESRSRLAREAEVYETITSPHCLKILDKNLSKDWIITAYQPNGTMQDRLKHYRGDALAVLKAIRPLVEVLSEMHNQAFVHRDFKPGNIFIGRKEELILGDAGLAFYMGDTTRPTGTYENVGTRDYMPAWAYSRRLKEIKPTFDVFSVGKVVWAMISGEPACPLWYVREDEFNLMRRFPKNEEMVWINELLTQSVVEHEKDMQITDGAALLTEIDATIYRIMMNAVRPQDAGAVNRTCRLCFIGTYKIENTGYTGSIGDRCLRCDQCGHLEFFMTKKRQG
jgi:serine/threonine protein kinase